MIRVALGVYFTGAMDKKYGIQHCTHGFLMCTKCERLVTSEILDLNTLMKYAAEIIHHHVTDTFESLGFTTNQSILNCINSKLVDMSCIRKCTAVSDRHFHKQVFLGIQEDNGFDTEEAKKISTNVILFIRCALRAYYGPEKAMYKKYIQRVIRGFE